MKKKIILSSALTIAMCASLVTGATYALFTSESLVNIAVSSGTVDVVATAGTLSLSSRGVPSVDGKTFATGGTATVTDGNKVTLTNIVPGDKVEIPLSIENKSNVTIQYRAIVDYISDNGLLSGVNVGVDMDATDAVEAESFAGFAISNWTTLEGGAAINDAKIIIDFPYLTTDQNQYQNKTAELVYTVQAVQGNGDVVDAIAYNATTDEYEISDEYGLKYLAALVNSGKDSFKGKTVALKADIDVDGALIPIGTNDHPFLGNFTGAKSSTVSLALSDEAVAMNYTIKNFTVENEGWAGVFGHVGKGVGSMISNLNVENVTINSNRMAGAVVGQIYGDVINCHVKNANITVVPNMENGKYDNGDKVGGIVGWLGDNNNNRTLSNCSAENVTIQAYRDVAAIAGYVASSTTVSNNIVKGVNSISADQSVNYYGDKDCNVGAIVGRAGGTITEKDNQVIETQTEKTTITANYKKDGMEYKQNNDDVVLYLIPADYEGDTVNVADGTTVIGNYAFAYNSNVKTVVLPETVTDLGRGFDSSTVEKVVLNEGLEKISSRAFRSTTALKKVVISSTVKEIADNAFQKSGLKSITIPATVETIGKTAFGSSSIEEVVIEGNTAIQGYAFRGCENLKKVVMKGDDVTFIAAPDGTNSMWFCNKESNNPGVSSMIFFVKNETVANRVIAAMGAEKYVATKSGDKYIVAPPTVTNPTNTADKLIENLESGNDVTLVEDVKIAPAGMSNAYGTTGINVKNGQTIDGAGYVLDIKGAGGTWDSGICTSGGLIKNITVTGSFRGIFIKNSEYNEKVVLENVIIDGTTYTISCDQGSKKGLEATNSTFKGWTSYAATLGNAKFTNCYFGAGNGYSFCRPYAPTEFVNCDFEAGFRMDPRAAVTFENCTIGGEPLTAENLATLVYMNTDKATVK